MSVSRGCSKNEPKADNFGGVLGILVPRSARYLCYFSFQHFSGKKFIRIITALKDNLKFADMIGNDFLLRKFAPFLVI